MLIAYLIAGCSLALAIKCFAERADKVKLVFGVMFLVVAIVVLIAGRQ